MKLFSLLAMLALLASCSGKSGSADSADAAAEKTGAATVPATVTSPTEGSMADSVILNATSTFLLKTTVKSSAVGYLQVVNAEMGRFINKGQDMFVIKTKEAQNLGNTITSIDSSFHFNGTIRIKAPATGYISQLNYRSGDYVQDGEQLAAITDTRSLVFILALPYELKPIIAANRYVQVRLPDGSVLNGTVTEAMPTVDSVSQTQNHLIRVGTSRAIPENLVAKVRLIKQQRSGVVSLPKAAVLSDETQTSFWVMKMINDSTAVKLVIQKGMENSERVEILSPGLQAADKILLTGNYGLGDTARVTIAK